LKAPAKACGQQYIIDRGSKLPQSIFFAGKQGLEMSVKKGRDDLRDEPIFSIGIFHWGKIALHERRRETSSRRYLRYYKVKVQRKSE
jgi:hypothetical protein